MESTLSLKKSDYEAELSDFNGWGRGEANGGRVWTAKETQRLQRDVASALRRFYFPQPLHDWSFLKPFSTLTMVEGASTLILPDDFGGLESGISATNSDSTVLTQLEIGNPGRVQLMTDQMADSTGRPQMASLRPIKNMPAGNGQKWELFLFPEADAAYTLTFQYYILPNYLTDTANPYAYGGAEHAETILEACLWVAEERRDNVSNGVHAQAFAMRLAASIAMDRRKKPQRLGYNRDNSDNSEFELIGMRGFGSAGATINGVLYD